MANHFSLQSIGIGSILAGKYRVERLLGQGGMGIVVAARHLELQEPFAIKLMQGREFANPRAVERFLREARAAVRLRSKTEHIVQVYDVGRIESGEPYIVMELLDGQDLAAVSRARGPLPIHEACGYIVQACEALAIAHQAGIVHRDIKPANLFSTYREDGTVCIKVLDFGISKVTTEGDESNVEMTSTREVLGSPLYMSPEQAISSRQVDARTDIWALGAILFKLLTGKPPFLASSHAEVCFALLASTPAPTPSALRADIPAALDEVILRCLDKTLERRYRTADELRTALCSFTRATLATNDVDDAAQIVLQRVVPRRTQPEDFMRTMQLEAEPAPVGQTAHRDDFKAAFDEKQLRNHT